MQQLLAQPAALPGPTLSRQPAGGSLETVRRGPAVGTPEGRASTALRELLTYATQPVGLGRVLITFDETNAGSRKAIEACGSLLDSLRTADQLSRNVDYSRDTLRYWVPTSVSSVS